jgi:hypothetical protein
MKFKINLYILTISIYYVVVNGDVGGVCSGICDEVYRVMVEVVVGYELVMARCCISPPS